jgi:hypothetical protein
MAIRAHSYNPACPITTPGQRLSGAFNPRRGGEPARLRRSPPSDTREPAARPTSRDRIPITRMPTSPGHPQPRGRRTPPLGQAFGAHPPSPYRNDDGPPRACHPTIATERPSPRPAMRRPTPPMRHETLWRRSVGSPHRSRDLGNARSAWRRAVCRRRSLQSPAARTLVQGRHNRQPGRRVAPSMWSRPG